MEKSFLGSKLIMVMGKKVMQFAVRTGRNNPAAGETHTFLIRYKVPGFRTSAN